MRLSKTKPRSLSIQIPDDKPSESNGGLDRFKSILKEKVQEMTKEKIPRTP